MQFGIFCKIQLLEKIVYIHKACRLQLQLKNLIMKNYNQVEVILFSKYSLNSPVQKELVKWLGTTVQSAIGSQREKAKMIFLRVLKDTPPIYLS